MDWEQLRQNVRVFAHHASISDIALMRFGGEQPHDTNRYTSDRVRAWRRRVLQKKGARIHLSMGADAGRCTLAMLDQDGIVVSWYDRATCAGEEALDHHVSQFYVPADIARSVPSRDLHLAALNGSCTQFGWRRRADGRVYWATTVIKAMTLRNGQLQGFCHITRRANASLQTAGAGSDWRPTSIVDMEPRRASLGGHWRRAHDDGRQTASLTRAQCR